MPRGGSSWPIEDGRLYTDLNYDDFATIRCRRDCDFSAAGSVDKRQATCTFRVSGSHNGLPHTTETAIRAESMGLPEADARTDTSVKRLAVRCEANDSLEAISKRVTLFFDRILSSFFFAVETPMDFGVRALSHGIDNSDVYLTS